MTSFYAVWALSVCHTTNHEFTDRELDILKELTTGDSNAEIARRMNLSVPTVKSHIQHLLKKTGFKTRTELGTEACRLGIVLKTKRSDTE
jgi:two-component system vancomycin resistance associated response regulator VraR